MLGGMRPHGSAKWLEKRRRRAVQLLKRGWSPSQVARLVSAARGSVYRWKANYEMEGSQGLRAQTAHGRPCKLSMAELHVLEDILLAGAVAFGFPNELWTLARIATVIRRTFHQRYHPSSVWWVLQRLGWSCQKPERRAKQRDEDKIAGWTRYHWPRIKKVPTTRNNTGFRGRKWLRVGAQCETHLGTAWTDPALSGHTQIGQDQRD